MNYIANLMKKLHTQIAERPATHFCVTKTTHSRKNWRSRTLQSFSPDCCLWETIEILSSHLWFSFPKRTAEEEKRPAFQYSNNQWNSKEGKVLRKCNRTAIKTADISAWQRAEGQRGMESEKEQEEGAQRERCRCEAWTRPSPTHSIRAYALNHAGHKPTHPPPHWSRQIPLMTKELSQHQLLGVLTHILSFSRSSASPVSS